MIEQAYEQLKKANPSLKLDSLIYNPAHITPFTIFFDNNQIADAKTIDELCAKLAAITVESLEEKYRREILFYENRANELRTLIENETAN